MTTLLDFVLRHYTSTYQKEGQMLTCGSFYISQTIYTCYILAILSIDFSPVPREVKIMVAR